MPTAYGAIARDHSPAGRSGHLVARTPVVRVAHSTAARHPRQWWRTPPLDMRSDNLSTLGGIVTQGGVALPYALVRVYERRSGLLLAQKLADASGNVSFPNFSNDDAGNYYVLALDYNSGYNAVIFDQLTPIASAIPLVAAVRCSTTVTPTPTGAW